jgi:hypothetical protein
MAEETSGAEPQEKEESPVFKFIKTVTGQTSYNLDGARKDFRALSNAAVASESALTSVPSGVEQVNISGKSVRHVSGDRIVLIDGSEILVVAETQTHTIMNDSRHFYETNRKVVVGSSDTQTIGNRHDVFVTGESTYQYLNKHEVTAPEEFEWKTFERGFSAYKLDTCLTNFDAHLMTVDTHAMDVELALLKGRGGALEEVLKGQKGEADALQLEVSIEVDIKGRGDVLVDIGIGTPFR